MVVVAKGEESQMVVLIKTQNRSAGLHSHSETLLRCQCHDATDPAYPHDLPADVRAPYRYTELPGRTLDLPPTDEFIHAIVDLRRAEMAIRENTPSPLLNSRSVQDAAGGQMFPVLNSIIRVRFIAACCDLVV